jgi:hypothetical protein
MATLSFTSHVDLDGTTEQGDLDTPVTLTITGDKVFATKSIVTGNTLDVLWTTGEGGLATFDVAVITTDNDIWVEFRTEQGTPEFVTLEVTASNPLVLTSDNLGGFTTARLDGAALVDDTDYGQVDRISVQNDGANTAIVTTRLYT